MQEVLRQRQGNEFVGRAPQCAEFERNLMLPPHDRKFVYGLHGQAGIGKTFLLRQLRAISLQREALVAVTDDNESSLVAMMSAIARQLAGQGGDARGFGVRLAEYERKHDEVLADPQAPSEARELVMSTAIRFGLGVLRTVPGLAPVADAVQPEKLQELSEQCRGYFAKRFGSQSEMRLLLSPVEDLTPLLVDDLRKLTQHRQLVLLFDNYERTSRILEPWLLRMLQGYYGELPLTLVLGVAGQYPLDLNHWGEYSSIMASWKLDPFSSQEARMLLERKGIRDPDFVDFVLKLSGGLPLMVATLAESGQDDVQDPTGMALERFLNAVHDHESRENAVLAALPRSLDEDILAAMSEPERTADLFRWLRERPFVRESQGRLQYDHVVRETMVRYERGRAPRRFRIRHQALAEHYLRSRQELGLPGDSGWYDWEWRSLLVEEYYHRLCAAAHQWLPGVMHYCAKACEVDAATAQSWFDMIEEAARDSSAATVVTFVHEIRRFVRPTAELDLNGLSKYLNSRLEQAGADSSGGGARSSGEQEYRGPVYQGKQDHFGTDLSGSAPPVLGE